jgi:tetratricopeptide (TPR) repeat protein
LEDVTRDEVRQDVLYYRAYCAGKLALAGEGDKTAAGALLRQFLDQYDNSYHYFEAVELFGDLAFSAGRYDSAAENYGLLAGAPWPDYQARAALAQGRALQAQDMYEEAMRRYETVLSSGLETSEAARLKLFANIGRAVCLAKTGKHQEGIKLLEGIIADNDPKDMELFSRAYNALGACHLEAERPKDALLAYLHVDILFFGQPDAHAEALYHLSKLWAAVNKSDRAVRARTLLHDRYADSVWATRP